MGERVDVREDDVDVRSLRLDQAEGVRGCCGGEHRVPFILEDAIRNLVENAVAHSPRGEEVMVEVLPDGRVSVADRGPGVPVDQRERIFERFWRGRDVETAGVGLGLAIVKKTMEAHRGTVEVRNNVGLGSIFTLTFPPAAADRTFG